MLEKSRAHIITFPNKLIHQQLGDIRRQLVKETTFLGLCPKKKGRCHPEEEAKGYSYTESYNICPWKNRCPMEQAKE